MRILLLYFTIAMYKCTKTSGSGKEYDAGDWEIKETDKTITFTRIRKSFYSWGFDGDFLKINKEKQGKHSFHDWGDGTFTIYPNRGGIPYYFEEFIANNQ